jgi:hypothetical protein
MPKNLLARKFLTAVVLAALAPLAASSAETPAVKIDVAVDAQPVAAGSTAKVAVRVVPEAGIKINRYPKIQVTVAEVHGLVSAASASLGNPKPPPVDSPESNYFKEPEPVQLELRLSADAPSGAREIEAEIKYFYCVASSGYCAPARSQFKIPVAVK